MKKITVYVADDNQRFDDPEACRAHEEFAQQLEKAMQPIGGIRQPVRIGHGQYVEHDPDAVKTAWQNVVDAFAERGGVAAERKEELRRAGWTHGSGWLGRFTEPQGAPNIAVWRFSAISLDGREYDQPYFAAQRLKELEASA